MSSPINMEFSIEANNASDAEMICNFLAAEYSSDENSITKNGLCISASIFDYFNRDLFERLSGLFRDTLVTVCCRDDDWCEVLYCKNAMSYIQEGRVIFEYPDFDESKLCDVPVQKCLTVKSFDCDQDLSKYTDSMLFESGQTIAELICEDRNGRQIAVTLEVRGYVTVEYDGDVYHSVCDFPEQLIEIIKNHPGEWDIYSPSGEGNDDEESNIFISENNWFEMMCCYNGHTEGYVLEQDLSKMDVESVKAALMEIATYCSI